MGSFETPRCLDVRFPTSRQLDGSDAMNLDPDYSAAYLALSTTDGDAGCSLTFTIGRGNDVQAAANRVVASRLAGRDVDTVLDKLGEFYRELVGDSQLRWLGPDVGVVHMAIGCVVNALWDLRARREGLPLWDLVSSLPVEELVDLVDFRYLADVLSSADARAILRDAEPGRGARRTALLEGGYPAYTTTPGWLGYDDAKLVRLSREAVADGFGQIKLKIGLDLDDDRRRLALAREAVGPGLRIAVDANQAFEVDQAIDWINALREFDPWWVEEPTSPDDVLGHAAVRRAVSPVRIATGEHLANRVIGKQLLQARALDVLQLDACRVGGLNENLTLLLLAARFDVPVCPHAGGVGLCEMVQHLSMIDLVAVSGTQEDRVIEYVDHLHEHFVIPARVVDGSYVAPTAPGAGAEMHPDSLERHRWPDGAAWTDGERAA